MVIFSFFCPLVFYLFSFLDAVYGPSSILKKLVGVQNIFFQGRDEKGCKMEVDRRPDRKEQDGRR